MIVALDFNVFGLLFAGKTFGIRIRTDPEGSNVHQCTFWRESENDDSCRALSFESKLFLQTFQEMRRDELQGIPQKSKTRLCEKAYKKHKLIIYGDFGKMWL